MTVISPTGGAGGVRISIAFDDGALVASPDWTDVTALVPNLMAGYDLDRGRQFELDYTDAGQYTVKVYDKDGLLDPTNSSGALYNKIEPDLQILVELWNPLAGAWKSRFRGWISDYDYDIDGSQRLMTLTLTCYDIFALLSTIEMQPGAFGETPPAASAGNIFYGDELFEDRIGNCLVDAGIPADFYVVFSGNVWILDGIYSPGDTPMNVIQDALDAEFPGVSNGYPDRFGRLAVHGRLAKFDPGTIAAGAGDAAWDYQVWKVGDAAAIAGDSTTVQMRTPYGFNRGRGHIINSANSWPKSIINLTPAASGAAIAGNLVEDAVSIGLRGYSSWSRENILIDKSVLTGNSGLDECKLFNTFFVANYAEPRDRVTALTIKAIDPKASVGGRAAHIWKMLGEADIADKVTLTVGHPGGGGFNAEPFFIEGIQETCEPATQDYAMVTMTLDVSPAAYFDNPEGLDGN